MIQFTIEQGLNMPLKYQSWSAHLSVNIGHIKTVTQTLPGMTTVLYIVEIKPRQPGAWWLGSGRNYHITKKKNCRHLTPMQ